MRVVVAADRPVLRGGLAALAEDAGAEVVASVDELGLPGVLGRAEADVVLLQLGGDADLDELADLRRRLALPLVCLVEEGTGGAEVLEAGASALSLDATAEELRAGLEAAAAGLVVLDPRVRGASRAPTASRQPADDVPVEDLTPREMQVLQLMARGYTNPSIARELGISQHTVKYHVTAVLGKLAASTRAEAVARGIRQGWLLV